MLSFVDIDREHDLAYILLRPELRGRRGAVARSVRAAEDIVLDLDESGHLIGIELLNASARLDVDELETAARDIIAGVTEAAEMLRVEKSNFVRDHANKPDFPAPIAELASGRFWLRSAIEHYVEEKKKPSKFSRQPSSRSHATSPDLEGRFHEMLVNSYWDVGRATGYWAHRFRQKVVRVGGLQAARDWLARKDIPSGLDRVVSMGRPDLALESMVLEDPWNQLFTPAELAIARDRLRQAIARRQSR
jgi:uncharacterized protein YuzE